MTDRVVRNDGKTYPVGPLASLGHRNHAIPQRDTGPARLIHQAARNVGLEIAARSWAPGNFTLVAETVPADQHGA
eukprot:2702176-Lingulodinium_polyedra.AAC.1